MLRLLGGPRLRFGDDVFRIPDNLRDTRLGEWVALVGLLTMIVGLVPMVLHGRFSLNAANPAFRLTALIWPGLLFVIIGLIFRRAHQDQVLVDRVRRAVTVNGVQYSDEEVVAILIQRRILATANGAWTRRYLMLGIGATRSTWDPEAPRAVERTVDLVTLSVFDRAWARRAGAHLALLFGVPLIDREETLDPLSLIKEEDGY